MVIERKVIKGGWGEWKWKNSGFNFTPGGSEIWEEN